MTRQMPKTFVEKPQVAVIKRKTKQIDRCRRIPVSHKIKNVEFKLDKDTGEYTSSKFKGCDLVKWDYRRNVSLLFVQRSMNEQTPEVKLKRKIHFLKERLLGLPP